jgi:hypothetical protein
MAGLSALVFTVLVDLSVFFLALCLFLALREDRGDRKKSAPLLGDFAHGKMPLLGKAEGSHYDDVIDGSSLLHLWQTPIGEIRNADVQTYLKFLQVLAQFFWVLSALGLVTLLPLYTKGQRFHSGLEQLSLENIPPGDPKLWVVCVLTAAVAVLGYVALAHFRMDLLRHHSPRDRGTAVLVLNIDRAVLQSSVLYGYFHRRFPGSVTEAHMAGDFRELEGARRELAAAKLRLTKQRAAPDCCRSTAVLEERVAYHERACARLASRGPTSGTGVGFVVFADAQCAADAVRHNCAYGWVAQRAPPPTDIEWGNLQHIGSGRWIRGAGWTCAVLVLMVIVLSPVAVLFRLQPVLRGVASALHRDGGDWYVRGMIASYCPPMVVFLVNSFLTPSCIQFVAARQRHWRKSSRQHTILSLNAVFLMLNTFLVPLMSLQSIPNFVEHFVQLPLESWATSLGTMFLSSSGAFGLQYLASAVFLSNGAQLLQPLRTIGAQDMAAPFDFGYWYASGLSVLTLGLGFSVVVPLILPGTALYFTIKFYVDKYNFLYNVVPPGLDSSGRLAHAIVPYWCVALAVFEFCMGGFFVVQGDRLAVAGAAFCGVAVLTGLAGLLASVPPAVVGTSLSPGAYKHPLGGRTLADLRQPLGV